MFAMQDFTCFPHTIISFIAQPLELLQHKGNIWLYSNNNFLKIFSSSLHFCFSKMYSVISALAQLESFSYVPYNVNRCFPCGADTCGGDG